MAASSLRQTPSLTPCTADDLHMVYKAKCSLSAWEIVVTFCCLAVYEKQCLFMFSPGINLFSNSLAVWLVVRVKEEP